MLEMRISVLILLPLGLLFSQGVSSSQVSGDEKVIMCYFGSWSVYRPGEGKYDVEDIDPFLCTHIMFGFAGLNPNDYTIKSLDPWNDLYDNWGKGAFERFTFLKAFNPNLKTSLAIGGWNEGSIKYSDMVLTKERRSGFIESCVDMLLEHGFDGLDMDWEYPVGRADSPGRPEDFENYISLLREMREEFDKHDLQITAAVSAGYSTIDQAYDVEAMSPLLDFINLMSYDYHGWWDEHHFTGHNSPLYGRPEEDNDIDSPGYNFNMNFSVNYWLDKGAKRSQLLVGMATYGRGFVLNNQAENGLYAPARGGIPAGPYTRQAGYLGYNEICEKVLIPGDWKIIRDDFISAPYAFKGNLWLGYDDEESIRVKSEYVLAENLAGAMFWSLDTDDFRGKCGKKNPLIMAAAEVLNGGKMTTPEGWTTPGPSVSPTTNEPETPPTNAVCNGYMGPQPDPNNCHDYYTCKIGDNGWVIKMETCGEYAFNPATESCDWPYNVKGCEGEPTPTGDYPTTTFDPSGECELGSPLLPVPDDCNAYMECDLTNDGGTHYEEKHCGPGLAFNPVIQACDWPYNVPGCEEI